MKLKIYLVLLLSVAITSSAFAQLSDVYFYRSYSESEDVFIEMMMANMPSELYEGTLSLKVEAFKGQNNKGEKITDVLFTRDFNGVEKLKRTEYSDSRISYSYLIDLYDPNKHLKFVLHL